MLFLERTLLDLRLATYGLRGIREAKAGGSGPVSLRHKTDAPIGLVPATTGMEPPFRPRHAFNAPTLTPFTSPEPVSARDRPPTPPEPGQKSPAPVASTGGRSGYSGTLWERPAGPEYTRAEQEQG